ncbi:MAG: diadenylate cyclase CdaA [Firmicutes bacterium]|nr:diadenylate cyclase CdaA [Bacillota bacterium]MDD4692971.1 diadenylate cyclase CdaA [Bacillota bacterium]
MAALFRNISLLDIIDILLVAFVVYRVMLLIKGTRAVSLLKGVAVVFTFSVLSEFFGFRTVNWLIQQAVTLFLVALPIVFYPELRKLLERLGRGVLKEERFGLFDKGQSQKAVGEIVRAVESFSENGTGALIVLKRDSGLMEYIETGTLVDAMVSVSTLETIFFPNTPLHDGAVIIEGDRILAAGCLLPLSENLEIAKELGTRHRAAVGLSEMSDALVIVVSEETGSISLAEDGKLNRYLTPKQLQERFLSHSRKKSERFWPFGREGKQREN